MNRIISVLLASLTLSVGGPSIAQKTKPPLKTEQTSFGAEEPVEHPVKIPKDVLESLRGQAQQRCFEDPDHRDVDITSWFAASAIDLNNDGLPDLVVKPENACLFGANIVPFWIFRNTGTGYQMVLRTVTLGLSVLKAHTNGYRDIHIEAASAETIFATTYKFNGKRYAPQICWEQSIDNAQHAQNVENISNALTQLSHIDNCTF